MASGVLQVTPTSQVVRVSGTDWIEGISISAGLEDGSTVLSQLVSPNSWEGTHAFSLSRNFEQFRFVSLDFEVSTRVPTTTAGGYIIGICPDPEQAVNTGVSAKQFVRALSGAVSAPWWLSSRVRLVNPDRTWRYTSERAAEPLKTSYGLLLLVIDGPPTNIKGAVPISIIARWTLELASPCAEERKFDGPVSPRGETWSWISGYPSIQANSGTLSKVWNLRSGFDWAVSLEPPVTVGQKQIRYVSPSQVAGNNFLAPFSTLAELRKKGSKPSQGEVEGPTGGTLTLTHDVEWVFIGNPFSSSSDLLPRPSLPDSLLKMRKSLPDWEVLSDV